MSKPKVTFRKGTPQAWIDKYMKRRFPDFAKKEKPVKKEEEGGE